MPSALPDTVVTGPATSVTVRPLANDEGAPPLTLVGFGTAGHGTVVLDATQQALVYTPAPGFLGSDSFAYTVQDATGATAEGVVTVLVNDVPVANDDRALTAAGVAVTIPVLANDHDAQPLAIAALGTPGHGSVELLPDQRLRYHPQPGFVGSDSFGYSVVDPHGALASALVTVDVAAPNQPPVAVDDAATTPVDTPVTLDLLANDNDPDGDPLQLVGLAMPLHGSLAVAPDRTVTYTPAAGFRGSDEFAYTIADGRGGQASATARLAVVRPNAPPVAPPIAATTPAGTAVTLDLLAQTSDPDGDPRELIVLGLPAHGQVAVGTDRRVTYTPTAGFVGTDGFTYTVRDDQGASATGAVTVTVTAPPVTPSFPNGYAVRRRIVLPPRPDGAPPAAPFVVRIAESGPWLRHSAAGGPVQSAQGHDIRFELEDGTKLAHEIELYDGAAGRLEAWLRLPSWNPGAAARLLVYLGKPGLTQSEAQPALTWTDYLAVWDARTGADRSGNGRHLTPATTEPAELLGPAARYPGTSFAVTTSGGFVGNRSALTFQCWIRGEAGAVGSSRGLVQQGSRSQPDADQGIVLRYAPTGPQGGATNVLLWGVRTAAGTALLESAAGLHGTAAQALHAIWRAGELPQLYVDGVATTPSWAGAIVAGTATAGQVLTGTSQAATGSFRLGVGSIPGDAGTWLGLLDEARLRASAPSPAWIALEHLSQKDPQAFYGLGDDDRPDDAVASPTAVPRSAATTAGSWVDLDVLAAAHVPAGTPAPTIAAVGQPGNGLATIVAGKVRYTPAAGFTGSDGFTYTLAAAGKRSTAKITVTVTAQVSQPEYPPALRTIQVASDAQLRSAVAGARAGDHIVLADGTYTGATLTITANGTAQAPIVIRAARKLMAELRFTVTLGGDHLTLWGCKFTGDNGKVVLTGNHDRVLRCEFTGWRPGHAVRFGHGGSYGQVRYCHIHDPGAWTADELSGAQYGMRINLRFVGSAATFHRFGRVSHCLFKDTIARPISGNYDTGQTDWIEVGEDGASYSGVNAAAVIEDCLFDGHADSNASGALDIKISGVTVRRCTFKNGSTARLDFRYGQDGQAVANWFKGSTAGISVAGGNHLLLGNVLEVGARLRVLTGTMEWNAYQGTGRQRARNVLCVGNSGLLVVGDKLGTAAATLPADGTRIEAHTGTIQTQQNYAGSWDTPVASLLEQGTTYAATASVSIPTARELGAADVGPDAPWVG